MGFLSDFWNGLVVGQQIFLCVAVPATLILIIQIIMMLFGLGGHDADADGDADIDTDADVDVDADLDADGDGIPDSAEADTPETDSPDSGLSLFSLRGIISMLAIFGWSGFAFLDPALGLHPAIGITIAVVLGFATLVIVALIMKGMSKLQQSGNLDLRNAIGKVGQVYLTIPGGGKSAGKVNLTVQEQFKEFTAITTSEEPLKTGSYVRVVALSDAGVLVVEPINKQ